MYSGFGAVTVYVASHLDSDGQNPPSLSSGSSLACTVAGAPLVTSKMRCLEVKVQLMSAFGRTTVAPIGPLIGVSVRAGPAIAVAVYGRLIAVTVQADPLLVATHSPKVRPVTCPWPVVPSMVPVTNDFLHVTLVRLVVSRAWVELALSLVPAG